MRLGRFLQLQCAILKNHIVVRRDDVDTVRLDNHPVLDFINRHPCIAPYQVSENVPGLEMTDLEGLIGKNLSVTGTFKEEKSFRGNVLRIKKRDQIVVQP